MARKTLTIQEYETITSNVRFEKEEGYRYLDQEHLQKLEQFILEYSETEGDTDVLQFLKPGFHRNVGKVISVSNYVGVVQLQDGLSVEILPKVLMGEDDNAYSQTKQVFLRMLKHMREYDGRTLNFANLKTSNTDLYEIFISMFIREARELAKRGLKSAYLEEEDNLSFFKGKLSVNEHIKKNLAHNERFYVRYDEYKVNRPENRLIKATLLKLLSLTGTFEMQKEIRQVLAMYDMVEPSHHYQRDFAQVAIDRSTRQYELLIDWAKVFLFNKSFSTFTGTTTARALLFPMEKVFEAYVAKEMKKHLTPEGCIVSVQEQSYWLFDEPTKAFALRPDIVVTMENGRKIIMDTKWKRLSPDKNNYGISQADLYQMYAYAKKYGTDNDTPAVWLLYPLSPVTVNLQNTVLKSNDGVTVHVFFVDCSELKNGFRIVDLCNSIRENR